MNNKRFTYFKVPIGFAKQAIKDNANDEVFDFTLSNVLDKLNEQQDNLDELEKNFDDLVKWSSEIAKRNVVLDEKVGELQRENEQLRAINKKWGDDLHNCRLNKNIISEKLKMWQDVHKEYNIYNIKDFKELMKKVK